MGKLIVYGVEASSSVRSVFFALNALDLDYEFKEVNLGIGEHKTKEFLKRNPQHTVPVLEDNGEFLWDSHAIIAYLVRKYGKNDALYPKDFYQRAIVDQRLHFESGVLFPALRNTTGPIFFKNELIIPQEQLDAISGAFDFLELFLEHDYIAGKTLTIADFSILSTATSFDALQPIDAKITPKLVAWINRMSKLPYYEKSNTKGVTTLNQVLSAKLGKKLNV